MPPWSHSVAASLIHAAALRPCRAKARTGGEVPPGVQPARHGSCPSGISASTAEGGQERRGRPCGASSCRTTRRVDHPTITRDDDQAEEHQHRLVPQQPVADLGYHRELVRSKPGVKSGQPRTDHDLAHRTGQLPSAPCRRRPDPARRPGGCPLRSPGRASADRCCRAGVSHDHRAWQERGGQPAVLPAGTGEAAALR